MVSIRKRRHLSVFEKHKLLYQISRLHRQNLETRVEAGGDPGVERDVAESEQCKTEVMPVPEYQSGASEISGNNYSKDTKNNVQERELKRRKRQRRRQLENQETCMLRGVYYKNMKWQAAIKVEKKQIHLGTVSSMEEAAHLYDRAAYKCGREPNFELSEEEKKELQGMHWDEFLALTRVAIANKKRQKKLDTRLKRKQSAGLGINIPRPYK